MINEIIMTTKKKPIAVAKGDFSISSVYWLGLFFGLRSPAGSPNCYEKAGEGGPSALNQVFSRACSKQKNPSLASLAPQEPAVLSVPVSDFIHIPSGFVLKFFWVSFGILPLFYWEPQKNFNRTAGEMWKECETNLEEYLLNINFLQGKNDVSCYLNSVVEFMRWFEMSEWR